MPSSKEFVLQFLRDNKSHLESDLGVKRIGLFGSVASGTDHANSDVDLLVELNEPDFFVWSGLLNYLVANLHRNVDLITDGNHLRKNFKERIQRSIIYV